MIPLSEKTFGNRYRLRARQAVPLPGEKCRVGTAHPFLLEYYFMSAAWYKKGAAGNWGKSLRHIHQVAGKSHSASGRRGIKIAIELDSDIGSRIRVYPQILGSREKIATALSSHFGYRYSIENGRAANSSHNLEKWKVACSYARPV